MLKMTDKFRLTNFNKVSSQIRKICPETIEMIQKDFGDECYDKTQMVVKAVWNCHTSVNFDPHLARTSTITTPHNVKHVGLALEQDRRWILREEDNHLEIPKFQRSWKFKWNFVCSKFIPKFLTAEQKIFRFETTRDNLEMVTDKHSINLSSSSSKWLKFLTCSIGTHISPSVIRRIFLQPTSQEHCQVVARLLVVVDRHQNECGFIRQVHLCNRDGL